MVKFLNVAKLKSLGHFANKTFLPDLKKKMRSVPFKHLGMNKMKDMCLRVIDLPLTREVVEFIMKMRFKPARAHMYMDPGLLRQKRRVGLFLVFQP